MRKDTFDLAILDIMMPGRNGLDALASVRRSSNIPVIMLTARGDDIDRIVGLELGADDYLAKPCNPRELVARINAVLRRTGRDQAPDSRATIVHGDLSLHRMKRQVSVRGRNIGLTSTEFDVLRVLVENAGVAVSKADLSSAALGKALGPYDRGLEMHLSHIRRKLGASASGEERIVTVRNYGYLFVVPD
jgi:two-component system response regulator CpxR